MAKTWKVIKIKIQREVGQISKAKNLKGKYGVKQKLLEGWGCVGFINQETLCGKDIDLQRNKQQQHIK